MPKCKTKPYYAMNNNVKTEKGKRVANPVSIAYLGLITTMIVWGFVPVFLKKLLLVLTPTELSFSRFLLSGIALLLWVLVRQRQALLRILQQDLKLLLLCTFFGPLAAMVCFNFGILHVPSAPHRCSRP